MGRTLTVAIVAAMMAGLVACVSGVPRKTEAEALVERSRWTIETFKTNVEHPNDIIRSELPKARGVVIVPGSFKGAFLVGAEGGNAVLLARNADGEWSYPAFYSLGSGSFGLQAGAQTSETVLLLRTDKAVQAVVRHQGRFGADAELTFGTIGVGMKGATTANLGADIIGLSHSAGAFAGVSLEGGVLVRRNDLNEAYYGAGATPQAIVLDRRFANPHSESLRSALVM